MTRKDFRLIAATLRDSERSMVDPELKPTLATKIVADVLAATFPQFNRQKFIKATQT